MARLVHRHGRQLLHFGAGVAMAPRLRPDAVGALDDHDCPTNTTNTSHTTSSLRRLLLVLTAVSTTAIATASGRDQDHGEKRYI
jgi:hypothetical protein